MKVRYPLAFSHLQLSLLQAKVQTVLSQYVIGQNMLRIYLLF